jgi:hypothetical protein
MYRAVTIPHAMRLIAMLRKNENWVSMNFSIVAAPTRHLAVGTVQYHPSAIIWYYQVPPSSRCV